MPAANGNPTWLWTCGLPRPRSSRHLPIQVFHPQPHDLPGDAAQRLDPLDGLVHAALFHAVGQHDERHLVDARGQLRLHQGLDADPAVAQDAGDVGEDARAVGGGNPQV